MEFKLNLNHLILIRPSVESSPLPGKPTEHFTQALKHLHGFQIRRLLMAKLSKINLQAMK